MYYYLRKSYQVIRFNSRRKITCRCLQRIPANWLWLHQHHYRFKSSAYLCKGKLSRDSHYWCTIHSSCSEALSPIFVNFWLFNQNLSNVLILCQHSNNDLRLFLLLGKFIELVSKWLFRVLRVSSPAKAAAQWLAAHRFTVGGETLFCRFCRIARKSSTVPWSVLRFTKWALGGIMFLNIVVWYSNLF